MVRILRPVWIQEDGKPRQLVAEQSVDLAPEIARSLVASGDAVLAAMTAPETKHA